MELLNKIAKLTRRISAKSSVEEPVRVYRNEEEINLEDVNFRSIRPQIEEKTIVGVIVQHLREVGIERIDAVDFRRMAREAGVDTTPVRYGQLLMSLGVTSLRIRERGNMVTKYIIPMTGVPTPIISDDKPESQVLIEAHSNSRAKRVSNFELQEEQDLKDTIIKMFDDLRTPADGIAALQIHAALSAEGFKFTTQGLSKAMEDIGLVVCRITPDGEIYSRPSSLVAGATNSPQDKHEAIITPTPHEHLIDMANVETIKVGQIYKKQETDQRYIGHACEICGAIRFVRMLRGMPLHVRCKQCASPRNLKNGSGRKGIGDVIEVGKIYKAAKVGRKADHSFIGSACKICGKLRIVQCVKGQPASDHCRKCGQVARYLKEAKTSPNQVGIITEAMTDDEIKAGIMTLGKQAVEQGVHPGEWLWEGFMLIVARLNAEKANNKIATDQLVNDMKHYKDATELLNEELLGYKEAASSWKGKYDRLMSDFEATSKIQQNRNVMAEAQNALVVHSSD